MSACTIHPEAQFDAVRAGLATQDDKRRLNESAKACVVCRIELIEATAALSETTDVSAAEARRHVQLAMKALVPASVKSHGALPPAVQSRHWGRKLGAAAAVLLVSASVAAATAYVVASRSKNGTGEAQSKLTKATSDVAVAPDESHAAMVPQEQPASLPAIVKPPRPRHASLPSHGTNADAASLLLKANVARREGRAKEASSLYQFLVSHHPNSREALAAQVFHGRLLLDRLGQPSAALARFSAYLTSRNDGTLIEDALVGQALALERLGRGDSARASWQRVLTEYPTSVSAVRARAALASTSDHAGR
jgi:TolA-binding protein